MYSMCVYVCVFENLGLTFIFALCVPYVCVCNVCVLLKRLRNFFFFLFKNLCLNNNIPQLYKL